MIYRVPNELSIVFPNSACPKCKSPIKPYDNIPIISWLVLGGKCRGCKENISWRYPAVEALTGLVFLIVYLQIGFNTFLPVCLVFGAVMITLVFIDAEHMILPNVITYPLLVFALAVRIVYPLVFHSSYFSDLDTAISVDDRISGVGRFACRSTAWCTCRRRFALACWRDMETSAGVEAMGLGDVKMMLGVGALLGWRLALLSIFLAAFTGAVAGVAVIARQKDKDMQTQIPFGIFLGTGSLLALLFGEQLIGWYVRSFFV